jgi:hypothetical protein
MNLTITKLFQRLAPVVFALFAGFTLIPAGRAQSEPEISDSRFLLIFDTSADMKKRVPAVQAEVNELMASSISGQLQPGNSLGVWTFDKNLRTGQFPLQHWRPDAADKLAASLKTFVAKQHYANKTRFDALQPQLEQVIRNSGQLTVLIFCDGDDEIKWTPFDAGINQAFHQRMAEQTKTRQPFVLVFRTQLGKYTSCTMNFPPGMVNVPQFPPLPPPPAPVNTPPPAPPAPVVKPALGPPLIIIGTKVETNWPPEPAAMLPTNSVPVTPINPVAPVVPTNVTAALPINSASPTNSVALPPPTNPAPAIQTNAAAASPAVSSAPTNYTPVTPTDSAPVLASKPMASPNPVSLSPENSGPDHKDALAIGAALLIAAIGLAALAFFRSRRADRGSLISRSMRKD